MLRGSINCCPPLQCRGTSYVQVTHKQKRAPSRAPVSVTPAFRQGSGLFGFHNHLDGGFDVGVQVNSHLVLAHVAERAFA